MFGHHYRGFKLWIAALACLTSAAACADSLEQTGGGGAMATAISSSTSSQSSVSASSVTSTISTATVTTDASSVSASGTTSASTASSTTASSSSTGLQMLDGYLPESEPNDSLNLPNALQAGYKGFVASLGTSDDADVFAFQGAAAQSMHIAISDGAGGCPTADTSVQVQLFDADDEMVASQFVPCPKLDSEPLVASLPVAGTYRVRVTGLSVVPWYVLEIGVLPIVCGNGVIQANETCDDNNNTSGDGCDANCQVELPGGVCGEVEPNGMVSQATVLTNCVWAAGMILNPSDTDHFRFQVPADGYSVKIEVFDVTGSGCPAGFAAGILLYNAAGTAIAEGPIGNGCPSVLPVNSAGAANLTAGDYTFAIVPQFNIPPNARYVAKTSVLPPSCGDTVVQAGEQCDDGNQLAGDFCDPMCQFPPSVCPEVEPNGSSAQATSVGSACELTVGSMPVGDRDFYSFQVAVAGSRVRIETVSASGQPCAVGTDTVVSLFDDGGALLGTDDDDGSNGCSLVDPASDAFANNLAVGSYFFSVEEFQNDSPVPSYGLLVDVIEPGCGDGILQPQEECEDGNVANGDGCSAMCTVEGVFCVETEPNQTQAEASALTGMCEGRGAIVPVGDVDRYSFEVVAPNTTAVIEISNGLNACPNFDSLLRLYGPADTLIAQDDDSGADLCSRVSAAGLAVGTYTVEVSETGNNMAQSVYVLSLTLM